MIRGRFKGRTAATVEALEERAMLSDFSYDGSIPITDLPRLPVQDPAIFQRTDWFTALAQNLLFVNDDGVHGPELWRTDGSQTGTLLLKDIRPGPQGMVHQGGALTPLFTAGR